MHCALYKFGNMQWDKHIASVAVSLGRTRWVGLVVHTWGLRFGIGRDEIIVHWR